jgi:peptidyl-prolyl cis-trans isomerase SurA
MIRTLFLGLSLSFLVILIGCGTSNPILATIGDEKISLHLFEDKYFDANYAKTNEGWDSCASASLEEKERFLDLIIKYKLKVKEARAQGLEKDSSIVSEMDTYNVAVAQSYMIEKELIDPGVRQLYDRKKEEVRVSHILFRLPPNAASKDTLASYKRAMDVIAQIPNTPFDTLAFKFSEDPSAKLNHGDLGFFTGGRMVPEFEDACYSLKPGEYTKTPVRTQYGYHVLKISARQPNPGSVRISHILLRFNESLNDTAAVRDTIWLLYNQLMHGASFKEVAQKFSQDSKSASNAGDIGYFERERIQPRVADAFYRLQIDSMTQPMLFNYGYHIFKLTEKKALPEFEEIKKDLKSQYQQIRYPYEYKKYVEKLKIQYPVNVDSAAVKRFIAIIDTTKIAGNETWKDTLTAEELKIALLHCEGRPFTVNNFAEKVTTVNEYKNFALTPANIWMLVIKLQEVVAIEHHARHAIERYPGLAQSLKDFEEGTLLYRIEQDEVWKKVVVNDSLSKEYYTAHKDEYRWPERVNVAEIYTLTDSAAKAVYRKLQRGKDFFSIAEEFTSRPGYKEKKGVWGFQPFSFNALYTKASTMATDSVTAPFQYESGWSIIKVLGRDNAEMKTFEEALPEVASAYQETTSKLREQQWVEELKKKYPVIIHKEVLTEAFKRKHVESQ